MKFDDDPTNGTRAVDATIRPYAIKVNGITTKCEFDLKNHTFTLTVLNLNDIKHNNENPAPTEIFLPNYHFPAALLMVDSTGGKWKYNSDTEMLLWWNKKGSQTLKVFIEEVEKSVLVRMIMDLNKLCYC